MYPHSAIEHKKSYEAIDPEPDVLDFLMTDDSGFRSEELVQNLQMSILNKEECMMLLSRIAKLYNFIVLRLERALANSLSPSFESEIDTMKALLDLLMRATYLAEFTQVSNFLIDMEFKFKISMPNKLFKDLMVILTQKQDGLLEIGKIAIQLFNFLTLTSHQYQLEYKNIWDGMINYLVEKVYDSPGKNFYKFIRELFGMLPPKYLFRFSEEVLLPLKVMLESHLAQGQNKKSMDMESLDNEEIKTELLNIVLLSGVNQISRKTILQRDQDTIKNLFDRIRNSYKEFSPYPIEMSKNCRMLMLQILSNFLAEADETRLRDFASNIRADIGQAVDKQNITYIIEVITPLLSTPIINFLPICLHFDDLDAPQQSKELNPSFTQILGNKNLNCDALGLNERDTLLRLIQKMKSPKKKSDKVSNSSIEWKRILEVNPAKGFSGDAPTIRAKLASSDNIAVISQCLVGEDIVKIGFYGSEKMTQSFGNKLILPKSDQHFLFYYTPYEKLHILSNGKLKNLYGGQASMNESQITQALEYSDDSITIYYDDIAVFKYVPQSPDSSFINFNVAQMTSMEDEKISNQMSIMDIEPVAQFSYIQTLEIWVGQTSNQSEKEDEFEDENKLLQELESLTEGLLNDFYYPMRPGKRIFLAPKNLTIGEFLSFIFKSGEIIVPEFKLNYRNHDINILTKVSELEEYLHKQPHASQILDLTISSEIGSTEIQKLLHNEEQSKKTIIGLMKQGKEKFLSFIMDESKLVAFFKKVSLILIQKNKDFLDTYSILAEELEFFSQISSFPTILARGGDFFINLFQLINSAARRANYNLNILKIGRLMYKSLNLALDKEASYIFELDISEFVRILLKKLETLDKDIDYSYTQSNLEKEVNPSSEYFDLIKPAAIIGTSKPLKGSKLFNKESNIPLAVNSELITDQVLEKSLKTEIMNLVFSCLKRIMQIQHAPEFYVQCVEKIKIFSFVKVIAKVFNFIRFNNPDSGKLLMQFELLSNFYMLNQHLELLEMWSVHEDLAELFWQDTNQKDKLGSFSLYQRLLLTRDEIKAGFGKEEVKDKMILAKIEGIQVQMLDLVQKMINNIDEYYNVNLVEETNDVTKHLSFPYPDCYMKCLKPYCVDAFAINQNEHHYKTAITNIAPNKQKVERLIKEIQDLSESLPILNTNAIFVRYDSKRMDVMKCMIMGAEDTPYAHGAFEFDVFIPDQYPSCPPMVNLETTGKGQVRFNPNLYACGKVCLSLLGTWRGQANENWNPTLSTLLQVFVSIQSIIMTEEIYYNEPGHEKKTAETRKLNEGYSNIVKYANIKHAMIDNIRNPPKAFTEPVLIHFYLKKSAILEEVKKWLKEGLSTTGTYTGLVNSHNYQLASKFTQNNSYYSHLQQAFTELEETLATLNLKIAKTFTTVVVKWEKKKKVKRASKPSQIIEQKPKYADISQIDVSYDEKIVHKQIDITDEKVTNRWSRYIGAMGIEAVEKQANSQVAIISLNALGNEIAKNIILSGVKRLTIFDSEIVNYQELTGNFSLTEADLGKNRAEAAFQRLQALNQYVHLDIVKVEVQKENLKKLGLENYNLVICCDGTYVLHQAIDEYCRSNGIYFIVAQTRGVFSKVFCDFGDTFKVIDKTGEEIIDIVVKSITPDGKLELLEGSKHNLQDNDQITLHKITQSGDGLTLEGSVHKIRLNSRNQLQLLEFQGFKKFESGILRTMKAQTTLNFRSFEENISKPAYDSTISGSDFWADLKSNLIHFSFMIIEDYMNEKKIAQIQEPVPKQFSIEVLSRLETQISLKFPNLKKELQENKDLVSLVHWTDLLICSWNGVFPPLCAFLGGLVAQEAFKAVTKKYIPINQFFYYECSEIALPNLSELSQQNVNLNSRYSSLIKCTGKTLFQKLCDAKLFMVGAGAIGCELLKNYAMLGLGSRNGKIELADPDVIETSNLNRQFLFREKHLRKPKASTAAAVVVQMNPDLNGKVFPIIERVHEPSEQIFSDKFFEELNLVTNALDNIDARKYVDSRCVKARIPLLESGTLGAKGHVQVILPFQTESYGSQQDPQEDNEIPYCTLKMFPEEALHCMEWARDKFSKMFYQKPMSLTKILEAIKNKTIENQDEKILAEALNLLKNRPSTFENCLQWARDKFEKFFSHDINQLLYTYPLDFKTENGNLFWSLPKRPPKPIKLDCSNQFHMTFVSACACLRATIFGIIIPPTARTENTQQQMAKIASSLIPRRYEISKEKAQDIMDKNKQNVANQNQSQSNNDVKMKSKKELLEDIFKNLNLKSFEEINKIKVFPQEFEKDIDENFHVDVIYGMTNCRSENYKLQQMDWISVKLKAGRIIPALASTTAAIAGLQTIEACKIIAKTPLSMHKNTFLNLSVPIVAQSEPQSAPIYRITPELTATLWDRWEISIKVEKINSIRAIFTHLEKKLRIHPVDVIKGNIPVFINSLMSLPNKKKEKEEILDAPLEYSLSLNGDENYVDLTITFTSEESKAKNPKDPILKGVPPIRLNFQ